QVWGARNGSGVSAGRSKVARSCFGNHRVRNRGKEMPQAVYEWRNILRGWRRLAALWVDTNSEREIGRAGIGAVGGREFDVVAPPLGEHIIWARATRLDQHLEADCVAEAPHLRDELLHR